MVIAVNKKQDEYQAFYTSCDHISGYMAKLLDCRDGMSLLEPCAGNGALLDQIINNDKILQVTALELNRESVTSLKNKYLKYDNITIVESDFALYDSDNQYDRIIANPPYGAYQTPNKRKVLKEQYPDLYAKETYGIFLIKAMEMLKVGGKLVFIIPDTFMTLHMHEGLRKRLVHDYKIESITLFPSKFFPGVNFGYAGLSIISLVNEKAPKDWCFSVFSDLQSKYDFDI